MPALKLIQSAVVAASLVSLGGLATYEVWGPATPAIQSVPELETRQMPIGSNALRGVVIPNKEISASNLGADFLFHTSSGAGAIIEETAAVLRLAALADKRRRRKKIRFGAFEGY